MVSNVCLAAVECMSKLQQVWGWQQYAVAAHAHVSSSSVCVSMCNSSVWECEEQRQGMQVTVACVLAAAVSACVSNHTWSTEYVMLATLLTGETKWGDWWRWNPTIINPCSKVQMECYCNHLAFFCLSSVCQYTGNSGHLWAQLTVRHTRANVHAVCMCYAGE